MLKKKPKYKNVRENNVWLLLIIIIKKRFACRDRTLPLHCASLCPRVCVSAQRVPRVEWRQLDLHSRGGLIATTFENYHCQAVRHNVRNSFGFLLLQTIKSTEELCSGEPNNLYFCHLEGSKQGKYLQVWHNFILNLKTHLLQLHRSFNTLNRSVYFSTKGIERLLCLHFTSSMPFCLHLPKSTTFIYIWVQYPFCLHFMRSMIPYFSLLGQ